MEKWPSGTVRIAFLYCPPIAHTCLTFLLRFWQQSAAELHRSLGWPQGSALLVAIQHYLANHPVQSCSPRHLCGSKLNSAPSSTATLLAMKISGKMDIENSDIHEMHCNSLVSKTDKQTLFCPFLSYLTGKTLLQLFSSLPLLPSWSHLKKILDTLVTAIQQAQDFRGKGNMLDPIAWEQQGCCSSMPSGPISTEAADVFPAGTHAQSTCIQPTGNHTAPSAHYWQCSHCTFPYLQYFQLQVSFWRKN